jgi:type IV pilus assembly protein PilY1
MSTNWYVGETRMKAFLQSKLLALALSIGISVCPFQATADDIDIFTGSSAGTAANPNVLIVLDNTSNWRSTLGSSTQGETELNAIKTIVAALDGTVNLGLMMLVDAGGGGRAGAYISFPVLPMNATNKAAFTAKLNFLLANFGTPALKSPSNAAFGEVMFEASKYFGGYTNPAHVADDVGAGGGGAGKTYGDATKPAGTITFTHADGTTSTVTNTPADAQHFGPNVYTTRTDWGLADAGGYASTTGTTPPVYQSPISEANNCGKNYIIFIGNAYPNQDDQSPNNFTILSGLGGNLLPFPIPTSPSTAGRSVDEWTRFLFQTDVSPAKGTQNVTTFAIDVLAGSGDRSKRIRPCWGPVALTTTALLDP